MPGGMSLHGLMVAAGRAGLYNRVRDTESAGSICVSRVERKKI